MAKIVNINIKPIVYEKDTDGEYVIDTEGNRTVIEQCETINGKKCDNILPTEDYDYKVTITEFI